MNKFYFLISIFLFQLAFGQKDLITINGKVKDSRDSIKQIYALKVRLSLNDSLFIETFGDSTNFYQFQISRQLLNGHKPNIHVYQDLNLLNKLFPPPKECPYFFKGPDQYLSHRSILLVLKDNIVNYKVDFELKKVIIDTRMPCLNFEKNSTKLKKCLNDPSGDTVIYCIKNILIQNPTIIIEINTHSYDESNQKDLSLVRANLIKQKLVDLGIDRERIKTKGNGDDFPLINSKLIKQAKTIDEKEELKSRNRRAEIRILSFDYRPNSIKINQDK